MEDFLKKFKSKMEALEKDKIDSKKEFDACNISEIEFMKHKNYRLAVVK